MQKTSKLTATLRNIAWIHSAGLAAALPTFSAGKHTLLFGPESSTSFGISGTELGTTTLAAARLARNPSSRKRLLQEAGLESAEPKEATAHVVVVNGEAVVISGAKFPKQTSRRAVRAVASIPGLPGGTVGLAPGGRISSITPALKIAESEAEEAGAAPHAVRRIVELEASRIGLTLPAEPASAVSLEISVLGAMPNSVNELQELPGETRPSAVSHAEGTTTFSLQGEPLAVAEWLTRLVHSNLLSGGFSAVETQPR